MNRWPPALAASYLKLFDDLIGIGEQLLANVTIKPPAPRRRTERVRWFADTLPVPKATELFDVAVFTEWCSRITSLLDQVVPTDSTHRDWLGAITKAKCGRATITGLTSRLRGLKRNFEDGLFDSVPLRIERSIVSDYMGQAEALLQEGHAGQYDHFPAAVLAGAVLERWLRSLCERTDPPISLTKDSGDPKTLNPLIDDLKRAGAITETRAKQLRAYAAIRNHAAHGEFDQFNRGDVEQMIAGVSALMSDGKG
jgi:hypothetical protein